MPKDDCALAFGRSQPHSVDSLEAGVFDVRSTPDGLLAELLQLPVEERARLARSLLASLDDDAESEAAWHAEVGPRSGP